MSRTGGIVLALFLIVWAGQSWAESPSDRLAAGRAIAVIPSDAPPTYFRDKQTGKAAGFAVDVMNVIAERAGLRVDYIFDDNWTDIINKIKTGEADLIPGIGGTKERKKDLAFSIPIDNVAVSYFARVQVPGQKSSPHIRTVGVIQGSVVIDRLKNRADLRLVTYETFVEGLFDLLAGHIDALAAPIPTTMKLAQDSGVDNRIRVVGKPIMEITRAIAVRRNDTALLERLNKAMKGFVGSPAYQRIYVKWYGRATPYWTPGRIVGVSAFISMIIIAIVAGWRYLSVLRLNRELTKTIATRKKAEADLRESEAKFRGLVETTSDWIWEVDQSGAYSYASPQVKTLLGYDPQEVIGKTPFDLMPADEAQRVRRIFLDAVASHKPLIAIENNNLHKDGRLVALETSGLPIIDARGNLLGYRGIDRDITYRKQAEQEREKLISELQHALATIKTLHGLLPICSSCKKIRDDEGSWTELESYIMKHSEAAFTHGICSECAKKLYPGYNLKEDE